MFGLLFSVGYIMTYIASTIINKDSANFAIYASAAGNPIATIIFVATGLGTESTPIWSIIPAIILVTAGIILWKYWENKQKVSPVPDPEKTHLIPINTTDPLPTMV